MLISRPALHVAFSSVTGSRRMLCSLTALSFLDNHWLTIRFAVGYLIGSPITLLTIQLKT